MNVIKVNVNFKNRTIYKQGVDLTSGDYNSTKLVFEFDKQDGRKVFEMKDPDENLVLLTDIVNDEVVLVRKDENGNNVSLFNQPNDYTFEISLYDGESKLTSASDRIKVKQEEIVVDSEVVTAYLPIFDQLMNDIQDSINQVNNMNIDVVTENDVTKVEITRKDGTKKEAIVSSGGITDYKKLDNKPSINNIELTDDKTTEDLGIIDDVNKYIEEHKDELKGLDGVDGKDGYTPVKGVDYFDGEDGVDGKDYVLTETDKKDISKLVEVNIPTKVSELENDKNYLSSVPLEYVTEDELTQKQFATESFVTNKIAEAELSGGDVDLSGYATKDELNAKVDKVKGKSLIDDTEIERLKTVTNYDDTELKGQLSSKADKSAIPTKMSELTDDKGYLTSIPSDYKTKTENDGLYQEKGNYLTEETDPTVPSHVKSIKTTDITNWNNKSEFSGSYNDLTNKPTLFSGNYSDLTNKPTIPTVPSNISAFNNDKGYLTSVPSEYITESELNSKGYLTEITEEIKAEIAQMVIESFGGNPVFGYVDENNNIIVSGDLPDGTYTVMYEMEEGGIITIGNLILDNTVEYSITNNLTSCTNSNSAITIVEGESYSATITANSGYELKTVSVTMGGSAVSVSGGVISIASVTGDIVITAVAEEIQNEPENVLETVGYKTNTRIRSSTGEEQTMDGVECTNYIPITYGQTISLQNIKADCSGNCSVAVYNSSKQYVCGIYLANFMRGVAANGSAINGELISQKLDSSKFIHTTTPISANSGIAFIRFSANEITDNSIVKVQD